MAVRSRQAMCIAEASPEMPRIRSPARSRTARCMARTGFPWRLMGPFPGTPAYADAGTEYVTVRATDTAGSCSYFTLQVVVNRDPYNFAAGPVAYWDFADEGAANGSYLPGNGDRDDLDGDGAMDTDDSGSAPPTFR